MWSSASPNVTFVFTAVKDIVQDNRHTAHVFQLFCGPVCSNIFHPSLPNLSHIFPLFPISSACLLLRPGWQPADGRLHLPGAAPDPTPGHCWGGRRLLTCPSAVEELSGPDAPYDACSAPALSTLTSALTSTQHLFSPFDRNSLELQKTYFVPNISSAAHWNGPEQSIEFHFSLAY